MIRIWHSTSFFSKTHSFTSGLTCSYNLSQKLHNSRLQFTTVMQEREQNMYEWFQLWTWMLVTLLMWLLPVCCWHVVPGSQAGTHFSFLCGIVLLIVINNMKLWYLDMAKQSAEETYNTVPCAHKNLIYIPV